MLLLYKALVNYVFLFFKQLVTTYKLFIKGALLQSGTSIFTQLYYTTEVNVLSIKYFQNPHHLSNIMEYNNAIW